MQSQAVPILKGGKVKTRILRPLEFNLLLEGASSTENKTLLQACLLMGARYEEARRIQRNKNWFDSRFIHLPSEAQLKVKRTQKDRWIRLSTIGKTIIPYFLEARPLPSLQAWNKNLKAWALRVGLNPEGINSKTMRKTYESWLIYYYPQASNLIFLSQGHNSLTSLQHYLNLPFVEEEKGEIKKWVEGWL